jgi:hypothetical protein
MENSSGLAFMCGLVSVTLISALVIAPLLRRTLERFFGVTLVPSGRRNFRVEGAEGNKGCFIGLLYVILNIGFFLALFFVMALLIEKLAGAS